MLKSAAVFTLILFISVQGFKFDFFSQKTQTSSHVRLTNKLNSMIVGDQQVQKGSSITASVMNDIKGYIETAFVYSGSDYWKNVNWIQSKLNQSYPGDWLVVMFNSTNTTAIIPNQTFGVSTYSLNGSWWIYWRGVNHYQTSFAYYLNRQGSNNQNFTSPYCHTLNNMSYYFTDTFKNIVSAVESDTNALMNQASQIQNFLNQYNPNVTANVLVSKKLPFYACQWGVRDSNYMQASPVSGNTVLSFPRV